MKTLTEALNSAFSLNTINKILLNFEEEVLGNIKTNETKKMNIVKSILPYFYDEKDDRYNDSVSYEKLAELFIIFYDKGYISYNEKLINDIKKEYKIKD